MYIYISKTGFRTNSFGRNSDLTSSRSSSPFPSAIMNSSSISSSSSSTPSSGSSSSNSHSNSKHNKNKMNTNTNYYDRNTEDILSIIRNNNIELLKLESDLDVVQDQVSI